jgi:hypothetical protein
MRIVAIAQVRIAVSVHCVPVYTRLYDCDPGIRS